MKTVCNIYTFLKEAKRCRFSCADVVSRGVGLILRDVHQRVELIKQHPSSPIHYAFVYRLFVPFA